MYAAVVGDASILIIMQRGHNKRAVIPAAVVGDDAAAKARANARAETHDLDSVADGSVDTTTAVMASGVAIGAPAVRVKLHYLAKAQSLLALLSVLLVIIDVEVLFHYNFPATVHDNCRSSASDCGIQGSAFPITEGLGIANGLRCVGTLITVALLALQARTQALWHREQVLVDAVPATLPFWRSKEAKRLILEVLVLLLHPFPWMEEWLPNDTPTVFIVVHFAPFARLWVFIRWAYFVCPLNTTAGQFISAMTNVEIGYEFMVKTYLDRQPFWMCGSVVLFGMVVGGYLLRVADTVVCTHYPVMMCQPMSYRAAAWTLILTISTIGYGLPFVPYSAAGRFVTLLVGFSGVFVTAVIVAVLYIRFLLSPQQARVQHFLENGQHRKELCETAARAIQGLYRYHSHYSESVMWKRGAGGVSYRSVSSRLPYEKHCLKVVGKWKQLRRKNARRHINVDLSMYAGTLAATLTVHASQMRDSVQQLWDYLLDDETRDAYEDAIAAQPAAEPGAPDISHLYQPRAPTGPPPDDTLSASDFKLEPGDPPMLRASRAGPRFSQGDYSADDVLGALYPEDAMRGGKGRSKRSSTEEFIASAELTIEGEPGSAVVDTAATSGGGGGGVSSLRNKLRLDLRNRSPSPSSGESRESPSRGPRSRSPRSRSPRSERSPRSTRSARGFWREHSAMDGSGSTRDGSLSPGGGSLAPKMSAGDLMRKRSETRRMQRGRTHASEPGWARALREDLARAGDTLADLANGLSEAHNEMREQRGAPAIGAATLPKQLQMTQSQRDDVWI